MEGENSISVSIPKGGPKKRRAWRSILIRLTPIVLPIIFSGYQYSEPNESSLSIPYRPIDLQYELMSRCYSMIDYSNPSTSGLLNNRLNELVKIFFDGSDFEPVWTTPWGADSNLEVLSDLLRNAKYYGFPTDYFGTSSIQSITGEFRHSPALTTRVDLEHKATYSAFKFMLFLNRGIVDEDLPLDAISFLYTLPDLLSKALNRDNIKNELLALQPDLPHLRHILRSMPNFIDLHLSIQHTTPKLIDERLLARALYYAGVSTSPELEPYATNARAIAMLQEQFNLTQDTSLNDATHAALVSMLKFRYYQACLNLNRLRELGCNDEDFIFVNIPEFRLHVVEARQSKEAYNVIVGRKETPTPTFSSNIDMVITNPMWTVPRSIANREIIQRIRRDSTYLERNGYYVINLREEVVDKSSLDWSSSDPLGNQLYLRQRSSSYNALGHVKINFPNRYSVYIHDTPSRWLFSQPDRTFSHGCIRLENPDRLAQYLADRYQSENEVDISQLIQSHQRRIIPLKQNVKVHIQYITCLGNSNSDLEFFNDVYNLDRQAIAALFPDHL